MYLLNNSKTKIDPHDVNWAGLHTCDTTQYNIKININKINIVIGTDYSLEWIYEVGGMSNRRLIRCGEP